MKAASTLRSQWYVYLNEPTLRDKVSLGVSIFLAAVIVLNILEVVISSVPEYGLYFNGLYMYSSVILVGIFSIEYCLRIWVAAEKPDSDADVSVWQKRRAYIFSPMGLVDLLSFLPFLFWWLIPEPLYTDFRILKLISMARIFKLTRYSTSFGMLTRVYQENKNTLLAALMVMMILMFIASAGIYIFEREAQPIAFGSIPASMWWAFVTLTTVGYGDVTPITVGGKVFGALVTICGVGVAAMPAGIFASSFVQMMKEQSRKERVFQALNADSEQPLGHRSLSVSNSEQREIDYLVTEVGLTEEQAQAVVEHYRH